MRGAACQESQDVGLTNTPQGKWRERGDFGLPLTSRWVLGLTFAPGGMSGQVGPRGWRQVSGAPAVPSRCGLAPCPPTGQGDFDLPMLSMTPVSARLPLGDAVLRGLCQLCAASGLGVAGIPNSRQ